MSAQRSKLVKHDGKWITRAEMERLLSAEQKFVYYVDQDGKSRADPRQMWRLGLSEPIEGYQQATKASAAPEPATAPAPVAAAPDPAEVAEYCAANGAPQLAAGLIRDKATMEIVRKTVDAVGQIETSFRAAANINPEIPTALRDEMMAGLAGGLTTPRLASHAFLKWLADNQSPEIRGQSSAGTVAGDTAGNHGWDVALAKAGRARGTK